LFLTVYTAIIFPPAFFHHQKDQVCVMLVTLPEIQLETEYRSDVDVLVRDFYLPCLERSVLYRRAVGYFTSRGLSAAAQGLAALIKADGRMLLIASPLFDGEDLVAINRGYAAREDVVERALLRGLETEAEGAEERLGFLAWLIAEGRLDIRIAIPVDENREPRLGIYHEKLGLFSDKSNNIVAFTGSPNETSGGLVDNFETIDVFWSWDDPQGRVLRKAENFDRLWNNKTRRLEVVSFPDAVRRALIKYRQDQYPHERSREHALLPERWRHQDEAIAAFFEHERGVLEMATGTGKTHTALRIAKQLIGSNLVDSLIVAADGNDLLDQWYSQLAPMCGELREPFAVVRHYGSYKERDQFVLDPQGSILLASRANLPPALRALSKSLGMKTLLIHDEVHRLGSPGNRSDLNGLSESIRFRLGLSATPEREYDQEGTVFINNHVGPVIYRFNLRDAIARGILSPFDYHPIEWSSDADDRAAIQQVYKRAAAREASGKPMSQNEVWTEIAKVYKTSLVKVPLFRNFIAAHPDLLRRCIIFVETKEYGSIILEIVHLHRADFHTYFAEDESEILRRFARGELECLLTCHRLSEGIDIHSLSTVILLSSSRTRLETIQRMGRCLRVDPSNPGKRSNIVDFIRTRSDDDLNVGPTPDEERRDWLLELSHIKQELPNA
jgi:superfamily II DNA or RNA helicase